MRLLGILFFILVSSCASRSELARKYSIPKQVQLSTVPFIAQEKYHCGPATLAMMIGHLGKSVSVQELVAQTFTPDKRGSFQSDMITAVRRHKLLALKIDGLKNLLRELDAGNPVLVLQNLGLSWIPRWHYAVVVGYDLNESEMILHSGNYSYMRMGFYTFEKTWARSENWGLVITNPGEIPATVSEIEMIQSIAQLESLASYDEALLGYQSVLSKWPESLGALIGLGNIHYVRSEFAISCDYLKQAIDINPQSAEAWHNYSLALKANDLPQEASSAARKAISLCDEKMIGVFTQNLNELLQ